MKKILDFKTYQILLNLFFPISSKYGNIETYLDTQKYPPEIFEISGSKNLQKILSCYTYSYSPIPELITKVKLGLEFAIAKDFARVILISLLKSSWMSLQPKYLINIPQDPKRFLKRGFHLPFLMTKELQLLLQNRFPFLNFQHLDLFEKTISTINQSSLTKQERLVNLNHKFALKEAFKKTNLDLNQQNIFLIDDVTTTGSTLEEAARCLKCTFPTVNIFGIVIATDAGI
jgi:predicted amidophosphoribosyltransferase